MNRVNFAALEADKQSANRPPANRPPANRPPANRPPADRPPAEPSGGPVPNPKEPILATLR